MFEDIEKYMEKSLTERQSHINMTDDCIEIGGSSIEYRALLAHYLKTTIPTKRKIVLCHKCGNGKCSNVKHLYWGSYSENILDSYESGSRLSFREYTIKKYGLEKAKIIFKQASVSGGIKGGGSNKLTEDEITERIKIINSYKPFKTGWLKKASAELSISHSQLRRFIEKYMGQ